MNKNVVMFIVFMIFGVIFLLVKKATTEELDNTLKGKRIILTGTCTPVPHKHMNVQIPFWSLQNVNVEIVKAESMDKFSAIITDKKTDFGYGEMDVSGTHIKCDQKQHAFNVELGK